MFQFKQFTIHQERTAMKVSTDSCLFGAWVAAQLQKQIPTSKKLLDAGTGTGLLSLMIAQENNYEIDAIEIDTSAAQQARENVEASPWKERISIIEADLLVFSPGKKYDIIISNPPFYQNELNSGKTAKDIAHHSMALTLEQLFKKTAELLNEDGLYYFLLPYKRLDEIRLLISEAGLTIHEEVHVKPTVNHPPSRIMIRGIVMKPADRGMNPTSETLILSIKDQDNQYTEAFVSLLRPYYLYL